jgi:hypothetical protein
MQAAWFEYQLQRWYKGAGGGGIRTHEASERPIAIGLGLTSSLRRLPQSFAQAKPLV